jgi:hypothetical protein
MRLKRRKIATGSGDTAAIAGGPRRRLSAAPVGGAAGLLGAAERQLTPARGLAVVALAAAISLGGSQFSDYRAVEVGASAYRSVQSVTPAPELDRRTPRSAHGDWMLAIAGASVLVTALAVARNWRLARLLLLLGAAVVAVSLAVDAPQGLRAGNVAIAFVGADAVLLDGFWAQLFSGVTLIVVGPVLALQLREAHRARRARRAARGSRPDSAAPSLAAPSGAEGAAT